MWKNLSVAVLALALAVPVAVSVDGTATAAPGPVPVPASGQAYLGAFTPGGPYNPAAMDSFVAAAGQRPGVQMWFQGWGAAGSAFDGAALDAVAARGAVPMVSWEPWDWTKGVSQPAFNLGAIASGQHDAYVRSWAQAAAAWGKPMFLRFAHEMNASHYPWSEQVNGNSAGEYVRAWQHVHGIFEQVGATNVSWAWVPSISYEGTTPLARLYPGAAYVDWVGVDGYNGGHVLPWGGWLSFSQLFGSTLDELTALAPGKPQLIGEVASVENGSRTPSKADWITDMFAQLRGRPQIRAFIWFHENKEADWRVDSSAASMLAFQAGAADPRYRPSLSDAPAVTTSPTPTVSSTPAPVPTNKRSKRWLLRSLR